MMKFLKEVNILDIKNILVIVDALRFTKDQIVREIKDEGYKHNFLFANFNDFKEVEKLISSVDEVWTWGNVEDNAFYKMSKKIGADIWTMGK